MWAVPSEFVTETVAPAFTFAALNAKFLMVIASVAPAAAGAPADEPEAAGAAVALDDADFDDEELQAGRTTAAASKGRVKVRISFICLVNLLNGT
ncbi:MAG: hypothetical protein NVS3B21_01640 [Acidimicrobiales bacterium]